MSVFDAGSSGLGPSHAVSLAPADLSSFSRSEDRAQARSSSALMQHPGTADVARDSFPRTVDGSSASHSKGTFCPAQNTSPPSSPFKESHGASQLPAIGGQHEQDMENPVQHGQALQGRPSNLDRKSGGSLASRQSLAGPSDSCVSWGSFRFPEESRLSLEPLQQVEDYPHASMGPAGHTRGVHTHVSTDQARCREDSSVQSLHRSEAAASSVDGQDALCQSEQGEARFFSVDPPDLGKVHSEGSAAEDPFREAEREDTPAAYQQRTGADKSLQMQLPALSHWEMQQLSGLAVSGDLDGAARAGPMRPRSAGQYTR